MGIRSGYGFVGDTVSFGLRCGNGPAGLSLERKLENTRQQKKKAVNYDCLPGLYETPAFA
jgi:hypothetical protein